MVAKIGRFIGVIMALLVLSTSNGLHYTHDITHHHHCSSSDHQEYPDADECALCWFVLHQVSHHFAVDSLLPDIAVQTCINLLNERNSLFFPDGIERLQRNKDPPQHV
ncbi:hypothetical protein H8B06_04960 [Sphingobacterium sp. DN00404]|uniref:DUF2946 domain-containing protein n=1 Tax=Sphingobacterium micropteri TaxID=2763501 RepID=A0ABR7YLH7_9SPHI|nr:hypothetical protein [Sphingobacterium micropteri]MBD1432168.1 hypothetical protein [Sphingobacterium micropteri]